MKDLKIGTQALCPADPRSGREDMTRGQGSACPAKHGRRKAQRLGDPAEAKAGRPVSASL